MNIQAAREPKSAFLRDICLFEAARNLCEATRVSNVAKQGDHSPSVGYSVVDKKGVLKENGRAYELFIELDGEVDCLPESF